MEQPTWGLDARAAAALHRALKQAAGEGAAVLVISQDLDELFALAGRVAALYQGRLSPVLPASGPARAVLGRWMTGGELEEHRESTRP